MSSTFGYTTEGGSSKYIYGSNPYEVHGSLFSPAASGLVTSIHGYFISEPIGGTYRFKGLLITHGDLNLVTNGVGGASDTIPSGAAVWLTSTMSIPPSITASTDYLLAIVSNDVAGKCIIYYDTGSENQGHFDGTNDYDTPQNLGSISHSTDKFSIYATYNEGQATFGYTSAGLSSMTLNFNYLHSSKEVYSPSANGTVVSFTALFNTGGGTGNYRGALYDNSGNLVDYINSTAVGSSGWHTGSAVIGAGITSATSYRIGVQPSNSNMAVNYDTAGSAGRSYSAHTYDNAFSNPITWTDDANNYLFSIYVTYGPAGGGSPVSRLPLGMIRAS